MTYSYQPYVFDSLPYKTMYPCQTFPNHPIFRKKRTSLKPSYLQPSKMVQLLPILHLTILSLILMIYYQPTLVSGADNPTKGFDRVHLDSSNFIVEKPYDVPVDERYSFINGVHRFWVNSTDKPHMPSSNTKPRTEIRITVRPNSHLI